MVVPNSHKEKSENYDLPILEIGKVLSMYRTAVDK